MDKVSDLDINCRVRRALVRHWIDLGRLSVRTTRGAVHLSGSLLRLPNGGPALDSMTVAAIVTEIRQIPDVRRVRTSFENWVEDSGAWVTAGRKSALCSGATDCATPDSACFR